LSAGTLVGTRGTEMKKPTKRKVSPSRQKSRPDTPEAAVVPKAQKPRSSRAITLKDVAEVVGVSMQTVSYALNGTGSVSEELRAKIREVTRQMSYRPNRSAKAMRTGRSNTIGLVVNNMSNPFFAELAQAIERAAASARYAVLLIDARGEEVESPETLDRIEALTSHPVDGVVSTANFKSVRNLDLPVVFISGDPIRSRDRSGSDNLAGVLVEHLIELGHTRFGLVTSPRPGGVPVRRQTTLEVLERHKLAVAWEYVTPASERVDENVFPYLARRNVTAIVCSNDVVAISVLGALRHLKIRVPDDVSVVGYDGIAWSAIVTPSLTTVRSPFAEIGRAAIHLLSDRLKDPNRRARTVLSPAVFMPGESTGPPPRTR